MNSIKILASGSYVPGKKVENSYFEDKFDVDDEWIYSRTGIKTRNWTEDEKTSEIAINAVKNLLETNKKININSVELIIVASVSFEATMPGISFEVQKYFNIKKCMCMDISAGCSGYINGIDIARKYIELNEIKNALVIGVEKLSKFLDKGDINTAILLGDGAGATLLGKSKDKLYAKNLESIGQDGEILTLKENEKFKMDGKKIYKFVTTKVSKNINDLLKREKLSISDLKYIIPHQSNFKMIENLGTKIGASPNQIYTNIDKVGNTYNASIPIVLDEIIKKDLLKENDKIMLVGYGGGLNLGSILIEV